MEVTKSMQNSENKIKENKNGRKQKKRIKESKNTSTISEEYELKILCPGSGKN